MFPWKIPDEMVIFIDRQFTRFGAPFPPEKAVDVIGDLVLTYVAKADYFPPTLSESLWRYNNPEEGLSESEKRNILGPIEVIVKTTNFIDISFEQVHLCVWSALLWCWSEEGEIYVRFTKKI